MVFCPSSINTAFTVVWLAKNFVNVSHIWLAADVYRQFQNCRPLSGHYVARSCGIAEITLIWNNLLMYKQHTHWSGEVGISVIACNSWTPFAVLAVMHGFKHNNEVCAPVFLLSTKYTPQFIVVGGVIIRSVLFNFWRQPEHLTYISYYYQKKRNNNL